MLFLFERNCGGNDRMVQGSFTMLGKTLDISFPARVKIKGKQLTVEAKLTIDHTRWGMTYGADPAPGERQIYPEVDLYLKLSAQEQ